MGHSTGKANGTSISQLGEGIYSKWGLWTKIGFNSQILARPSDSRVKQWAGRPGVPKDNDELTQLSGRRERGVTKVAYPSQSALSLVRPSRAAAEIES